MSILWGEGSGTVAEVRDELVHSAGYTGVLKLLQILELKGMVRHEQEGRAYRYFPLVGPADAHSAGSSIAFSTARRRGRWPVWCRDGDSTPTRSYA
jgi:predicted transcriptional regulator